MTIMNSKGDSASPEKIPLWIFVSALLFPPYCQFNSPGFHGFLDEFYDFMWYFVHYFTPLEFFISVLADGFSQEFEWQQVSSSLQDSSQDSGRC